MAETQTRSFRYVDDLIDGLIRLMNSSDEIIGPINIGNPTEFAILQLTKLIIEEMGSRSRIVHRAHPSSTIRVSGNRTFHEQALLSWSPQTPLKDGIRRTIAYFEKLLADSKMRAYWSRRI